MNFLFSGPFVEVLPSSTLRMITSILQEGQIFVHFFYRSYIFIPWFAIFFFINQYRMER